MPPFSDAGRFACSLFRFSYFIARVKFLSFFAPNALTARFLFVIMVAI